MIATKHAGPEISPRMMIHGWTQSVTQKKKAARKKTAVNSQNPVRETGMYYEGVPSTRAPYWTVAKWEGDYNSNECSNSFEHDWVIFGVISTVE